MADFDENSKKKEKEPSKKSVKSFFSKLIGFISRYKKNLLIAFGGLLVIAAIVIGAVILFTGGDNGKASDVYSEPVLTLVDETDEETVVIEEEEEKADYISVGMIIADVANADEIVEGFARYADKLIGEEKLLDKYFIYQSGDSENQQIQDTRALLARGCNSIVLCGISGDSFGIISGMCSAENVALIGIDSSEECCVSISGSDAWYGGYVESVKAAMSEEDSLIFVSDSADSEFTVSMLSELEKEGIIPDSVIYGSDKKYSETLAKASEVASFVLLSKGNYARAALTVCLTNRRIPKALVTRATVGIIKDWHDLKNEGIVISEAVEADEKHEAIPEERIASESAALYAYAGQDGKMLGCAACRFAFNFSQGKALIKDCEYTVYSTKIFTDEDVEALYAEYSDFDNDYNIAGEVNFDEIDKLFTESTENGI